MLKVVQIRWLSCVLQFNGQSQKYVFVGRSVIHEIGDKPKWFWLTMKGPVVRRCFPSHQKLKLGWILSSCRLILFDIVYRYICFLLISCFDLRCSHVFGRRDVFGNSAKERHPVFFFEMIHFPLKYLSIYITLWSHVPQLVGWVSALLFIIFLHPQSTPRSIVGQDNSKALWCHSVVRVKTNKNKVAALQSNNKPLTTINVWRFYNAEFKKMMFHCHVGSRNLHYIIQSLSCDVTNPDRVNWPIHIDQPLLLLTFCVPVLRLYGVLSSAHVEHAQRMVTILDTWIEDDHPHKLADFNSRWAIDHYCILCKNIQEAILVLQWLLQSIGQSYRESTCYSESPPFLLVFDDRSPCEVKENVPSRKWREVAKSWQVLG